MIEMMKVLYQTIDNAHDYETHNAQAPTDATYPYAIYKVLPLQSSEKDRNYYTLEISCWDKGETSHTRVLQMAEDIRRAILGYRHLDKYNLIIVDRPTLGYVPDSDAKIKRYDVTANLKTYRRLLNGSK